MGADLAAEGRMPRQVRIEFEGASYHVMYRGDRREAIFQDEQAIGSVSLRLQVRQCDGPVGECTATC